MPPNATVFLAAPKKLSEAARRSLEKEGHTVVKSPLTYLAAVHQVNTLLPESWPQITIIADVLRAEQDEEPNRDLAAILAMQIHKKVPRTIVVALRTGMTDEQLEGLVFPLLPDYETDENGFLSPFYVKEHLGKFITLLPGRRGKESI